MVPSSSDPAHRWDLIDSIGQRLGVLAVRAEQLSDPHRALYANLSRIIAHDTEQRRSTRALEERFRRLDQHAEALAAQQHALSSAAYRDSLTGLYRPWYLTEQLRLELARAHRHKRPLSLAMFDLHRFVDANHRFGRRGGDDILRAFASRLSATCRTSDVVARVGGDEFAALLPDTSAEGAAALVRRLRRTMDTQPVVIGETTVDLTVSAGITTFIGERGETPESLLESARRQLQRTKYERML